ncbi:hypothetical protein NicSoilE8_05230 [Arthrobacter sp. NicSoilE8]|nr:hypothetical protein NicSoilE8_05230 [Arthrobacter sp. NicSoilE8]
MGSESLPFSIYDVPKGQSGYQVPKGEGQSQRLEARARAKSRELNSDVSGGSGGYLERSSNNARVVLQCCGDDGRAELEPG